MKGGDAIHQQRDREKGETDIELTEEGKCVAGLEELMYES